MVQWLRLQAPSAGGPGWIPPQGTRSHMPQLIVCMPQLKILSCCLVAKLVQLFCYPHGLLLGPSVHGISQARMGWVAISFSSGSSQPQGSNPCLPHWQADALPLSHQGSLKPRRTTPVNLTLHFLPTESHKSSDLWLAPCCPTPQHHKSRSHSFHCAGRGLQSEGSAPTCPSSIYKSTYPYIHYLPPTLPGSGASAVRLRH